MTESKTIKIIIAVSTILLLIGAFSMWQKGWMGNLASLGSVLDIKGRDSDASFWSLLPGALGFNEEKTYLVLFQNNMEIRPSGGFLGSFGILKVKNGRPLSFETHDTTIFDGFGSVHTDPPKAMKDYLGVKNWQMRDGNWSPDFSLAAQQVEYFYHLQGGQEDFDGVVAVNAAILPAILDLTGPIYLEEFDATFQSEDVLYQLEYEVEKGYVQQGLSSGDRKEILKSLADEVLGQLSQNNFWEHIQLKDTMVEELNKKNVLLYFKNEKMQNSVVELGWGGNVDQEYDGNYLMLVEANLGGKKSNYYVERKIEYFIDLTLNRPQAELKIEFNHSESEKNWFNWDYLCYLRTYIPKGSWMLEANGVNDQTAFLDELNKTVFGNWIVVPAGTSKTVTYKFLLPENMDEESLSRILIQKQSGVNSMPVKITIKTESGTTEVDDIIEFDVEVK